MMSDSLFLIISMAPEVIFCLRIIKVAAAIPGETGSKAVLGCIYSHAPLGRCDVSSGVIQRLRRQQADWI